MVDFSALFDALPNPYMVVGPDGRYLAVNRAYAALLDVAPDALVGEPVFRMFPGAEAEGSMQAARVQASLQRAFETGLPDVLAAFPYSIERDTPAGRVVEARLWSATHTPLFDPQGRVHAVLQHATDITDPRGGAPDPGREQQLAALLLQRARNLDAENRLLTEQRTQLMSLFEQAPGFMAVLRGPDYVFEIANTAYENLVGRRDLIGHSARRMLPELVMQGYFDLLDAGMRSGRPFVGRGMRAMIAAPGEPAREQFVDFVFQPLLDAQGRATGMFIQGADVTEREAALAALRESESRFRAIADTLPQMVWATRPDGFHDYYNARWYEYTGMPEGSTDGEAWSGMFHPDDQARAWEHWRDSLASGEPYEVEYRLRHRSGEYRWTLGRALAVRDAEGRIVRWLGTCTEIHKQKLAEAALREAARSKDQFLAMLAHELRNPLAPITTAARLLQMPGLEPEHRCEASAIIARQAAHMTHLVNDLLDVSRVTRGLVVLQRRRIDIPTAVRAAVEQAAPLVERKQHRLRIEVADVAMAVDADLPRLVQVFANLLGNAAKYTPPGGNIEVSVAPCDAGVCVEVRDDGIGLEADMLAAVFELFTQVETAPERSEGGLGIGLALVRSLVELHGGRIVAASEGLGRGAVFRVELPLAPAAD